MSTRWTLHDLATGETWTMPINPDSMSSPIPTTRNLRFSFGKAGGRHRTFLGAPPPQDWEWSGVIRTQQHYDDLATWARKSTEIDVTDHLGRTFRCFLTDFLPVDRHSTRATPWRLRYTMKTKILRRVA